jgi:predicted DNA-binding protein (MmcQ/YjbR family)
MNFEEYNHFCQSLPVTTHVVQWGDSHVWKVGGKVFAIGSQHGTDKPAFSFKTSDHNFALLSDQSGYRPAPYLASRGLKWIQIYDTSCATSEEIKYYLAESHRIVALGLTKKLRKQLGLGNSEA